MLKKFNYIRVLADNTQLSRVINGRRKQTGRHVRDSRISGYAINVSSDLTRPFLRQARFIALVQR